MRLSPTRPTRTRRALTMTEMIIAAVLITILAAFTVPTLTSTSSQNTDVQAQASAQTALSLAAQIYSNTGLLPTDPTQLSALNNDVTFVKGPSASTSAQVVSLATGTQATTSTSPDTFQAASLGANGICWVATRSLVASGSSSANATTYQYYMVTSSIPPPSTCHANVSGTLPSLCATSSSGSSWAAASGCVPLAASAVSTGMTSACAITKSTSSTYNGTVQCWGSNAYGQLGVGSNAITSSVQPLYVCAPGVTSCTGSVPNANMLKNVTAISVGTGTVCALTTAGAVDCWGYNANYQVGNNNQNDQYSPVQIIASGASAISAPNPDVGCALLSNTTVKCWGYNVDGAVGNYSTEVAKTPEYVCATATTAGTCTTNLTGATAISTNGDTSCAVITGGTIECWGYGLNGQLGNGTTSFTDPFTGEAASYSLLPVTVSGISTATAVSVGQYEVCALLSDTTVKCWGDNTFGELGNSSTTSSLTPVAVSGLSGVTQIDVGGDYACATAGANGYCWGYGNSGRLGNASTALAAFSYDLNGASSLQTSPALVCATASPCTSSSDPLSSVTYVAAGDIFTCAIGASSYVYCFGDNTYGQLAQTPSSGSSSGSNSAYALLVYTSLVPPGVY